MELVPNGGQVPRQKEKKGQKGRQEEEKVTPLLDVRMLFVQVTESE